MGKTVSSYRMALVEIPLEWLARVLRKHNREDFDELTEACRSKELKKGFPICWSKNLIIFMKATGIVIDRITACFHHNQLRIKQ